jgi:2,3-dihydro-2,3-dihydroxybenzoate dehydrogenase
MVTGAASGIGASIAARFRAKGDRVAGIDRDEERLLSQELDVREVCDVRDDETTQQSVERAVEALGGLDVLISSAGVTGRGTVADTSLDEWDRIFEINVRGLFVVARHAIPHLRASHVGTIVNVASQLGIVAAAASAAYCASKAAAIHLTRAMAIDHAEDGITVNAICPGPTATPMGDTFFTSSDPQAERRAFEQTMVTGRFVQPEEVAAMAFYLAQPDNRSMTGAVVVVDGGYILR